MTRTGFVSTSTAPTWEHGVVVGTGSLGVVIHGDASEHFLEFTHEEGFFPLNPRTPAPPLAAHLGELRALVRGGRRAEAADLVERIARENGYDEGMVWTDPFLPLATVRWRPTDARLMVSDYRRTVDLTSGRAEIAWSTASGIHRLAVVPDRAGGRIVVELSGDSGVDGELEVALGRVATGQGVGVGAVDYSALVTGEVTVDGESARVSCGPSRDDWRAIAEVRSSHAAFVSIGDSATARVVASPGDTVRVDLSAGLPVTTAPHVLRRGSTDHADLVGRSSLDLAVPDHYRQLSTEDLLDRARRLGDPVAERAIVELAFATGKHTIVSATGTLPPNLVGVWAGTLSPAWSGDYTLNGNVPLGTVAALTSTGTPELLLALFRLLDRFGDDYRNNARRLFGADGWMLPSRLTTHGRANHFSTDYPHEFWIGCGGWMLRLAFDYFSTTGDREFALDWALPFAREVLAFYDTALESVDGVRHANPSYSPENTPEGFVNPFTIDAASDIAAVRDAYLVGSRLARLAGADADAERWLSSREELPGYRIAEDGTFAEWIDGATPENHAHRHITHLHPFIYEGDERIDGPEWRRSARALVAARLGWRSVDPSGPPGRMEMAFGLSQAGIAAAQLGDAVAAETCAVWLARDHVRPSMMTTHDAGALFNADAAGALPALVAAMLVGSTPTSIDLLPGLPETWSSGVVRGLTARGAVIVEELSWSPERIEVVLHRRPGSKAAWPDRTISITVPDCFTSTDQRTFLIDLDEGPQRIVWQRSARGSGTH